MIFVGLMMFGSMKCFANIAEGVKGTCNFVITDEGQLIISPINGVEGKLDGRGYYNDGNYGDWYTDFTIWYRYRASITSVSFKGVITAESCANMFQRFYNLESIEWGNFKTDNVTTMTRMFEGCLSLKSLDLSGFNTSKVTNMERMFMACSSLESLNLGSFNTSNVINMQSMFCDCSSLTSLDVGSFNTSKVTNMFEMFSNCRALTNLNLGSFNTSKVTNMSYMFMSCVSLTSLDVSKFNTGKVTNMECMFANCVSLTSLDASKLNTRSVVNMTAMFNNCPSLTSLDLTYFTIPSGCSCQSMFYKVKANIISNSEIPSLVSDAFFDSYEPNSPYCLVVPSGSENEYFNASGWRHLMPHVMTDENPMVPQMKYNRYMLGYERKVSGQYATFCLPFDFNIGTARESGFSNEVYTINSVGEIDKTVGLIKLSVQEASESTILKTGTPFIVKVAEGQDKITFFSNSDKCDFTKRYPEPQKLSIDVASDVDVTFSGTFFNKLTDLDKTKYRAFNTDGDFGPADWVNTFRAYVYKEDKRSSAKVEKIVLCFEDGTTTSLDEIDGLEVITDNAPIYNLNGQRVNGDAKGLLIKNGKKMFVK